MTEPHRPWEVCGTFERSPEMAAALTEMSKHIVRLDPADRPKILDLSTEGDTDV